MKRYKSRYYNLSMSEQEIIDFSKTHFFYEDGGLYSKVDNKRIDGPNFAGYRQVYVNKVKVPAQVVIWLIHYGPIETGLVVDHRDRDPSNNVLDNLRLATPSQNSANTKKSKIPASGYTGVYEHNSRWYAKLRHQNKQLWLGSYLCKHDAAEAYNLAAIKHRGEFAILNVVNRNTNG